jgi:cobyrinic acid a,c-diamide synthase
VTVPRVVIAAPQGRSGKTTVCVGLCAATAGRGLVTQPFKKGPDYIDPSWLSAAAGRPCRNLDLFMMSQEALLGSFHRASRGANLAVIEGAHGLYDGVDLAGSGSTAQLARLLGAPVILVVNATRMTRSVAALVSGYQRFEPDIEMAGVILNNVATGRHESMLVHAIRQYCQIPVLGCLPKARSATITERHLGLVPEGEATPLVEKVARARELVESYVDIDAVLRIAQRAPALTPPVECADAPARASMRLGVVRDQAFSFYYPENLESLEQAGAELLYVNALEDSRLPAISGLYIGGGFPEMFGERLQANSQLREEIRIAIDQGLPVYAECAGLLYLARTLHWEGHAFEMVGALPIDVDFTARPQGHGYVAGRVVGENPYLGIGRRLLGHEFHHAKVENADDLKIAYSLERGNGIGRKRDGIVHKNVLAGFTHLHALSEPSWAEGLVNPTRSGETERRAAAPAAHGGGNALQP